MKMNPTIFREYDIRGIAESDMDADFARLLGRAVATRIRALHPDGPAAIAIGRDCRLTSDGYAEALAAGVTESGVDVVDIGMCPTPLMYFSLFELPVQGGLQVTASHNASEYNGFKICIGRESIYGESITRLREEMEAGRFSSGRGSIRHTAIIPPYQRYCAEQFGKLPRKLKVVVDGGNGMAGEMVGPLLDEFPIELISTYWVPDGNFPDHEPNPLLPENREFIIERVRSEGADLGIAWDGDADRCFFIDDEGEFVDGDFLTALLAELVLEKVPGADILYDVRASRAVPDTVAAHGGTAHINRVGHAFMKRAMKEIGGEFAGEVSGHYYFRQFYNADSGTIPALLVLELVSKSGRRLSDLVGELRSKYFISGEINSEVADPEAKMKAIAEQHPDAEIAWLDGVSVDYEDWHFNVRPSNTEPLLRLNLESLVSREDMEAKRDEVLAFIRS